MDKLSRNTLFRALLKQVATFRRGTLERWNARILSVRETNPGSGSQGLRQGVVIHTCIHGLSSSDVITYKIC